MGRALDCLVYMGSISRYAAGPLGDLGVVTTVPLASVSPLAKWGK